MNSKLTLLGALCCFALVAVGAPTADTIYHGGSILTIEDAHPRAEAVSVKDGKILAVGTKADVLKTKGDATKLVVLGGKMLLPGFVDSHGHTYMIGIQATTANLLPPPDGTGKSTAALQALLRDWTMNNQVAVKRIGWIAGFGYDDSQLAEQRHPTREDLDAVSTELPVIIIHQSGHLGVANSKALEIAGVTAATKDPKGGVFRRKPGSQEPNGVCEEYAFFAVMLKLAARFDNAVNEALVIEGAQLAAFNEKLNLTLLKQFQAAGIVLADSAKAPESAPALRQSCRT